MSRVELVRWWRLSSICLTAWVLFSCSASPAPTEVKPADVGAPTAAPIATAPPRDPSAPGAILAEVHISSIGALLDLAGIPRRASEIEATLVGIFGPEKVALDAEMRKLAELIDLDGHIDLVIVGAGPEQNDLQMAVSVPVRSLDAARAALGNDDTCQAATTPSGRARLVCADSAREIRALSTYLLQHEEKAEHVVRARLDAAAVRGTIAKSALAQLAQAGELVGTETEIGRVANNVIDVVGREVAAELDDLASVEVSLTKEASGGLRGDVAISFRTQRSWLAATLAEIPDPPVTAAFAALPQDRDFTFSYGWPSKERLEPVLVTSRELLAKVLSEIHAFDKPADGERVANLVMMFGAFRSPIVTAQGYDPPRALAKGASLGARVEEASRLQDGWNLAWAPGAPDDVMRPYLELAEVANLPSIKKILSDASFTLKRGAAPAELGPGAKQIGFDISAVGTAGKAKTTMWIFLMPGHGGAWTAYGVDRARLLGLLKDIRATEGAKAAPKTRPNTPAAGSDPGLILQTSTRSILLSTMLPEGTDETLEGAAVAWDKIGRLPNKGRAEILVRGKSSPSPLKLTYRITVPKEAADDLAVLAKMPP